MIDQYPRKNVADPAGSNPQPPDHQLDAHLAEPLRATFFFCVCVCVCVCVYVCVFYKGCGGQHVWFIEK